MDAANDPGMRTRTVLVSAAALLVLAICTSCGSGGGGRGAGGAEVTPDAPTSVAITWSGSDAATAGYVVHWGATSGTYAHDVDVRKPAADGNGEVTVVMTLDGADPSAARFFFAITSYDDAGASSAYSNELSIEASAAE